MHVIPVLQRLRLKDQAFKASLDFITKFQDTLVYLPKLVRKRKRAISFKVKVFFLEF
jgi:hypothetical protein